MMPFDRRVFLGASGAAIASIRSRPVWASDKNDRPVLGMIGCGSKGRDDARLASTYGDFAVVCDVDAARAEQFAADPVLTDEGAPKIAIETDYEKVLERQDIDAVVVATPDHWHTKVFVETLQAGKHLYGEKPMTLTIDEVKVLRRVALSVDRVFQVGNQQRSCQWFREAVAIARSGALGSKLTAVCTLGAGPSGGPFKAATVPIGLNWDKWLGQAPETPYLSERCHGRFRWWSEYSGGKLTDWGAHHIDIALWAINGFQQSPIEIEGSGVIDDRPDCFNAAQTYSCKMKFENGNTLICRDGKGESDGVLFEGDQEHIFVNRGKLAGNLVGKIREDRAWKERIRDDANRLYPQQGLETPFDRDVNFEDGSIWLKVKQDHMANFFRCIQQGGTPVSDANSVGVSTICCHLANISIRLGRPLRWDPATETFINDSQANDMLARKQRVGYEVIG
jgi:myo-inositol 2-dehydrogenase/D-chiro-inositol 1-dehydrogenase